MAYTVFYEENEYLIDKEVIITFLNSLLGRTFQLLPLREEGQEYNKPITTIIIELLGFQSLNPDLKDLFQLTCKLEGLRKGEEEIDFHTYRRTIFECCNLIAKAKENVS